MGAEIEWKYREISEENARDILREVPDRICLAKLVEKDPGYHGYVIDSDLVPVVETALEKCFDQLQEIREKGLGTHAHGHAKAFCFKKVLDLLNLKLIHYPRFFRDVFEHSVEILKSEFDPLHKVLIANIKFPKDLGEEEEKETGRHVAALFYVTISKRDKDTLIRAYWPGFLNAWNEFHKHNWINEYKALWLHCFAKMKPIQKLVELGNTEVKPPVKPEVKPNDQDFDATLYGVGLEHDAIHALDQGLPQEPITQDEKPKLSGGGSHLVKVQFKSMITPEQAAEIKRKADEGLAREEEGLKKPENPKIRKTQFGITNPNCEFYKEGKCTNPLPTRETPEECANLNECPLKDGLTKAETNKLTEHYRRSEEDKS